MTPIILIADDDFDNRMIAQEALSAAGYRTALAVNGLEALDLLMRIKPDLLLLDLSMPKLNGWDVAKRLRQIPEFLDLPVIAFTAHALEGEAEKAKAAGCSDYLAKPCAPKVIVEKVHHWLAPRQSAPNPNNEVVDG